jgi:hypothetical protein
MIRGGTMAIQKKSLITALKSAKKANLASAKPPAAEGVPEVAGAESMKSIRKMRVMRSAKKSARHLKSIR